MQDIGEKRDGLEYPPKLAAMKNKYALTREQSKATEESKLQDYDQNNMRTQSTAYYTNAPLIDNQNGQELQAVWESDSCDCSSKKLNKTYHRLVSGDNNSQNSSITSGSSRLSNSMSNSNRHETWSLQQSLSEQTSQLFDNTIVENFVRRSLIRK